MLQNLKIVLVTALILLPSVYAQENKNVPTSIPVDSFGKANGEDRSARFDNFFIQLKNQPAAMGYVFVFCGKTCRYGEIESHFRGIELKIAGSRFDRERIVVIHGGYRDNQEVELWLKPKDASPPTPQSTRNIKHVTFKTANRQIIEPYDCCDDISGQWKAFRPK